MTNYLKSLFISYCKSQRSRLRSHSHRVATVVSKFLEVFINDLNGIPIEWEIDFGFDLLSDINLLSILPYRMAPADLKESKAQLKDLLD